MSNESQLSDEAVVTRVRGGDTGLFEIVLRRYNQRLFRAARAILRDDSEAEDAVQQAYVLAYTHLAQFEGTAQFSTWLTRIAVREALGRLRKRKRLGEVDLDDVGEGTMEETEERSPEQLAARHELTGLLEAAVDTLPAIYRVVFVMREVEQLSTVEVAHCLELSEEAVKVRLHRARAMLRDRLFERMGDPLPHVFQFLGERCDRIVAAVMLRITRPSG